MEVQDLNPTAEARATVASAILEDLGYGDMTVDQKSFNDDDYYVFNPLTLELKAHFTFRQRHLLSTVRDGHAVEKGMRAKYLGLWKIPAEMRKIGGAL